MIILGKNIFYSVRATGTAICTPRNPRQKWILFCFVGGDLHLGTRCMRADYMSVLLYNFREVLGPGDLLAV